MTKKETARRKEMWTRALAEGRVVRYSETTLVSYPTIESRDAAIAKNGFGRVVQPDLSQPQENHP